jgi:hypothetical protein
MCCTLNLQALLHFMYWDELPDIEELTGVNTTWVSTLMAQHLLAAADRYALERLKLLCELKLCENVAINTVANTLALAEQHHCYQLKTLCLKFVALPENLKGMHGISLNLLYIGFSSHRSSYVVAGLVKGRSPWAVSQFVSALYLFK